MCPGTIYTIVYYVIYILFIIYLHKHDKIKLCFPVVYQQTK